MGEERKQNGGRRGIAAVLLCGGGSRRLSFPKEMLRVDGEILVVKLADRLAEACGSVSVVTNRPEYLRTFVDFPIYEDEYDGLGPLAGIHAGLKRGGAERSFFLACDMPLVHIDMMKRLVECAAKSRADAVVARGAGRVQPLFGVYAGRLAGRLEGILKEGKELSVIKFLDGIEVEFVDFEGEEAERLGDVDTVADMRLLKKEFADVEPLPVREELIVRGAGGAAEMDIVAEEWPIAVIVNGTKLATVMCLPTAIRELVYGFLKYLGLAREAKDVSSVAVDYQNKRVQVGIEASDERIGGALQLLVTSTCGANVYGGRLPELLEAGAAERVVISRMHILECIKGLRAMAPVFERTGCTHQAAYTEEGRVRYFFEDIGRHNAIDKIVGAAMLDGAVLSGGAIVTTGRLNSEMVVKALRGEAPVLASRSAATTNAIMLAERYGLTLVGFARGGRLNIYAHPERVGDD